MTATEKEVVVRAGRRAAEAAAEAPSAPNIPVVAAAELDPKLKATGPLAEVPPETMDRVQTWLSDYNAYLAESTGRYVERVAAANAAAQARKRRGLEPEVGEPTVGPYVAFDVLMISPIQLITPPVTYAPSRIVAGGELAFLLAYLWANPAADILNGFAVPANFQLGNRNVRVSFDQLNLTNATAGPNFTFVFNLGPAPIPPIIPILVPFITPAVATPELIEVNVTADILDMGQPYAAFGTWQIDIDAEPPWWFLPGTPSQLQHDIPMRYMVYPRF